jgi:predicted amino acid-binding ACT domain protein
VAAGKAGIRLSEAKKAFLVQGDDRTGAVLDTVSRLAEAKINITATMATAGGAGRYGLVLWVAPADYEAAAKALV